MDSSVNSNYPENTEAEVKWLLERNEHLEKTLEQHRKKKWKTFTDRVDYGYFKPRDMTQLQKTGKIIEELDQVKVTGDVDSIEGVKENICREAI